MSNFTAQISITLPAELAEIAVVLMVSPSAERLKESCPPTSLSMALPILLALCTARFKAQADYLLEHPADLFAFVAQDYATRWPDLVPPTLAECEAFCSGVIKPEVIE